MPSTDTNSDAKSLYSSRQTILYGLYAVLSFFLFIGTVLAPWFAAQGNNGAASTLYNFYKPLCHQYIERSFCYFPNATFPFGNCITSNKCFVETRYTNATPYSGFFHFSKADVGRMRAEVARCFPSGKEGFKFAVCSRDFATYLAMFLTALAFLPLILKNKRVSRLSFIVFVILILPLILDGTLQLFTSWESSNLIRFFTGFLAGVAISAALIPALLGAE